MLHCNRKYTFLGLLAIGSAMVLGHQLIAQTPVLTTTGTFKETVTIISSTNGIHADDGQSTLYTVPSNRILVIQSIVIANDQDNYTDVLIKEGSVREMALLRIPLNSSFCHSMPTGIEFAPDSKVNVENLGGPGGTQGGDIHVTLNGYLKKTGT